MVASTLAPLTTAIDELLTVDADLLDDTDIHELVVELGRQTARLEAAYCRIINRWDRRQIWADNGSKSPAARLARETRIRTSDASRLVHRARALASMPATDEAYAAGEITGAHVDLVARCDRTWRNTTFAESEAVLVDSCKTPWFDNAVRAIAYWKQLADRDAADDDAEMDREGRHAAMATGWRGEGVLNAVFDPVGAETFRTELDRLGEQLRLQDQHDGTVRTVQQRRADALVEMATRSATAPAGGLRPRPLFTVTIGIDPFNHLCETAAGTVIAPGLLIPLLSDADIERIVYDPPPVESKHPTGVRSPAGSDGSSKYVTGTANTNPAVTSRRAAATSITSCRTVKQSGRVCATGSCCASRTTGSPKTTASAHHSPNANAAAIRSHSAPTSSPPGQPPTPTPTPRPHPERRPRPADPSPAQPGPVPTMRAGAAPK